MSAFKSAVEWLNAVPGRKRTIGVLAAMGSAGLRALGHSQYADTVEGLNALIQGLTAATDILTLVFGTIGVIDAKRKGTL